MTIIAECFDLLMTYAQLLLPSYFHLIITVLFVTFLQSILLTMLWHKCENVQRRYMPVNFTSIMSFLKACL